MDTREKIISYFSRRGAHISVHNHTITAEFPGDVTTVQTHFRGALEAILGQPTPMKTAYYQELVNAVDTYDYRRGDEIPWEHTTRIYHTPVIVHHHATGMRPEAIPNEQNSDITNDAELVLPGIGSAMKGYEISPNGTRRARLHVSLDRIASYITTS